MSDVRLILNRCLNRSICLGYGSQGQRHKEHLEDKPDKDIERLIWEDSSLLRNMLFCSLLRPSTRRRECSP